MTVLKYKMENREERWTRALDQWSYMNWQESQTDMADGGNEMAGHPG